MPAATIPAIIGAAGTVGGALLSKGKKTEYTSGLSPQAQGISNQMANYISGGMNKPTAYANVNPMAIQAMDMISKMFTGKAYSQPDYGQSAMGGGPSGWGQQAQQGQGGYNPYPQGGYTPYGMPRQMGPQIPAQTPFPPTQYYGGGMPQGPGRMAPRA
jgi:hypothetical protein